MSDCRKELRRICLLDADEKKYFSMLPVGQGIVKLQDRWMQPIHVKFPLMNVKKGSITDAMLARYSALKNSKKTGSGRNTSVPTYFNQVPQIPTLLNSPLNDDSFKLLSDILTYPQDGVKIRYKRLNLSTGKGTRLKEHLLDHNWLESQIIDLGQTRKTCLRLTPLARDSLNLDSADPQHGSIVHEYWKRLYAQRFSEQGYKVELEVPRISGQVDVVARKNNNKIAIEIETGKSNYLRNVRQNLLARYNKIIVVSTDKFAYERIEKDLAAAGLLIPQKVTMVLRDEFIVASEQHKLLD